VIVGRAVHHFFSRADFALRPRRPPAFAVDQELCEEACPVE
jgi:hypothetical protein